MDFEFDDLTKMVTLQITVNLNSMQPFNDIQKPLNFSFNIESCECDCTSQGCNSLCIPTESSQYGGHGLVHAATRRIHNTYTDAHNVEPKFTSMNSVLVSLTGLRWKLCFR